MKGHQKIHLRASQARFVFVVFLVSFLARVANAGHPQSVGYLMSLPGFLGLASSIANLNHKMRLASENPLDKNLRILVRQAVLNMAVASRGVAKEFKSGQLHNGDVPLVSSVLGGFVDVNAGTRIAKFLENPNAALIPSVGRQFPSSLLREAESGGRLTVRDDVDELEPSESLTNSAVGNGEIVRTTAIAVAKEEKLKNDLNLSDSTVSSEAGRITVNNLGPLSERDFLSEVSEDMALLMKDKKIASETTSETTSDAERESGDTFLRNSNSETSESSTDSGDESDDSRILSDDVKSNGEELGEVESNGEAMRWQPSINNLDAKELSSRGARVVKKDADDEEEKNKKENEFWDPKKKKAKKKLKVKEKGVRAIDLRNQAYQLSVKPKFWRVQSLKLLMELMVPSAYAGNCDEEEGGNGEKLMAMIQGMAMLAMAAGAIIGPITQAEAQKYDARVNLAISRDNNETARELAAQAYQQAIDGANVVAQSNAQIAQMTAEAQREAAILREQSRTQRDNQSQQLALHTLALKNQSDERAREDRNRLADLNIEMARQNAEQARVVSERQFQIALENRQIELREREQERAENDRDRQIELSNIERERQFLALQQGLTSATPSGGGVISPINPLTVRRQLGPSTTTQGGTSNSSGLSSLSPSGNLVASGGSPSSTSLTSTSLGNSNPLQSGSNQSAQISSQGVLQTNREGLGALAPTSSSQRLWSALPVRRALAGGHGLGISIQKTLSTIATHNDNSDLLRVLGAIENSNGFGSTRGAMKRVESGLAENEQGTGDLNSFINQTNPNFSGYLKNEASRRADEARRSDEGSRDSHSRPAVAGYNIPVGEGYSE